jgi:hypothetical protein
MAQRASRYASYRDISARGGQGVSKFVNLGMQLRY